MRHLPNDIVVNLWNMKIGAKPASKAQSARELRAKPQPTAKGRGEARSSSEALTAGKGQSPSESATAGVTGPSMSPGQRRVSQLVGTV